MKFVEVDSNNLFHRAIHSVSGDYDTKAGMALHIIFSSLARVVVDHGIDHVVFCFEGRSWRRDFYAPYKANRDSVRNEATEEQVEESQFLMDAFNDFQYLIEQHTNCTVLQHPECEADDFIAHWIAHHPDDTHLILSTDSDFYQLIAENVSQYNGVSNTLITLEGMFDDKGKPIIDKKTKLPATIGDPEYVLFEKCVRGDKSDNIFSAYPGVRKKGSKNRVGILEAFADRHSKKYEWNNFMMQTWEDVNDEEHRVLDDFERNRILIDLTLQPDHIKEKMDNTIVAAVQKERKSGVGMHFLKFCGRYQLQKLGGQPDVHATYLNRGYAD